MMDSLFILRLSVAISLITLSYCCKIRKNESAIIVVALPEGDSEGAAIWEKGKEIFPGAVMAIKRLNSDSCLLPGTNVMLVTANSGFVMSQDEPYSGDVLEVVANLTWHNANIIGIAGLLHRDTLLALQAFRLPIVPLIHFSGIPNLPIVFHVTASGSVLIDSVLVFLSVINHTRIGIITESSHSYYSQISNELLTKGNVSLYIHVSNNRNRFWSGIADEIANSNIHVVFLSARPSIATHILCEACRSGLMWPNYTWILHSYRLDDLREFEIEREICHDSNNILEGVFMFQLAKEQNNFQSDSNIMQETNPFSLLLHDAVWALALAAGNRSFHPFTDNVELLPFLPGHNIVPSNIIHIYQSFNLTTNLVGIYNGTSKMLTKVTIGTFIIDDFMVLYERPSLYFISIPLLLFLFNTALLILYILFRNDPDVKSTNVYLSLLIFLGNYSTIVYTLLLLLFSSPHMPDLCPALVWVSGVGFSSLLVHSSLLVKMLLVCHIFALRKRLKSSVYTLHCAPFVYTFLIMSPSIIIITLWNIVDPYHRTFLHIERPGTLVIVAYCTSNHRLLWIALLIAYVYLLYFATVLVAVKTRKIRFKRFRDTKKVNLLIFIDFFIKFNVISYWIMLTFLITDYLSLRLYILVGANIMTNLVVQFTLIVPKVWPPFSKKAVSVLKSIWHTIK